MAGILQPGYASDKNEIVRGFDGNIIMAVKAGAPTASASGYSPSALFHDVTNGVLYQNTGTATSATWSAIGAASSMSVQGVASGYKLARGAAALDGSNPTTVATGLTTIVSASVSLNMTSAPGLSTSVLTCDISGANLNVYAWKPTGAGDTTLVASTGTENFYWVAVGT